MKLLRYEALVSLPLLLAACGGDESAGTGGAGTTATSATDATTSGAGGAASDPAVASVTRYDLAFDLASSTLTTSLSLDVVEAGSCYTVPSMPTPTDVELDGVAASSAEVTSGALTACGPGLAIGPHTLRATDVVSAGVAPGLDVGFSNKPHGAGTFTYLLSWVGGCDRFGPCDDRPSALVHFTYDIAHPPGTTALCPGTLVAGATQTHCDLLATAAPTYSAFAVMADTTWKRAPFTSAAGVDVVFYEAPNGALASSLDAASFQAFLGFATTLLGPFPYGSELRFAGAPTKWLGFEHPANVVLDDALPTLSGPYLDPTMHVAMHETIHQWAGDRSTIATAQDFAWKEAIAEYLAYVFEDEQRPVGEAAATRAYWDAASLGAKYHVRPTDDPPPAVEAFYGDVYGPGPMLLFVQLEPLVGRAAVLSGIRAFLQDPGARSVADLEAALEAASGASLGPYFDAWVFGAGAPAWPSFAVSTQAASGMVTLTVTQSGAQAAPYPGVVEVELDGATESLVVPVSFGLNPSGPSVTVSVPFAEAVTGTKVDPAHRIVDVPSSFAPLVPPRVYIL